MSIIHKVVVVGGGVLGSQIAFQTAYCGFDVTILERENFVNEAIKKVEKLRFIYLKKVDDMKHDAPFSRGITGIEKEKLTQQDYVEFRNRIEWACHTINVTSDFQKACKNADLVIEAVTENLKVKIGLYKKLSNYLEDHTILTTNSSTILPSILAPYTGRPEKYLAIHFANHIWEFNNSEIMGHEGTNQECIDAVVQFAKEINMVPLRMLKENKGYILNAMLIPLLTSAQGLWVKGVAEPETIDKTWKYATGSQHGPFEIVDHVGIKTAYDIVSMSPNAKDPKSHFIKLPTN